MSSIDVLLYRPFRRFSISLSFFTSITILIPSLEDSSLTSWISSKTLSFIRFARFSTSFDLFPATVYGISVITIFFLPLSPFSISTLARSRILPSPVSYICSISSAFIMVPPVGKSGAGIYFINPFVVISGLSI